MNIEQEKWFKKLKNLIGNMPKNTEISVCIRNQFDSEINLHNGGDIRQLEEDHPDRAAISFDDVAIDSFYADNVIANSECI